MTIFVLRKAIVNSTGKTCLWPRAKLILRHVSFITRSNNDAGTNELSRALLSSSARNSVRGMVLLGGNIGFDLCILGLQRCRFKWLVISDGPVKSCRYDIVAAMCNVTTEPWDPTQHFSLNGDAPNSKETLFEQLPD
jgi:hypothetical protein